jgi:hypothetical protein
MIWRHFEKTLKCHQYGHLMKGLSLGSNNMLFIFWSSCLFTFCKQTTICLYFKKFMKGQYYGYQMKALDLGNKNMFILRFLCLFTFRQHKQLPMVARFFKGYASLEVTRPREVATDLTFLTGFTNKIYMVE